MAADEESLAGLPYAVEPVCPELLAWVEEVEFFFEDLWELVLVWETATLPIKRLSPRIEIVFLNIKCMPMVLLTLA